MAARDQAPQRVFGYARVSSEGQADNTSLAVQAERIRSFTAARGWPDPQVIEDIASGANLVRPGLASVRDTLRSGALDAQRAPEAIPRAVAPPLGCHSCSP